MSGPEQANGTRLTVSGADHQDQIDIGMIKIVEFPLPAYDGCYSGITHKGYAGGSHFKNKSSAAIKNLEQVGLYELRRLLLCPCNEEV